MNLKEKVLSLNPEVALSLSESEIKAQVESIISRTFLWMGVSLLIAFWIWYMFLNFIKQGVINTSQYFGLFVWSAIWGFVLVVVISWAWQKLTYAVLATLFVIFAILEGIGLTGVFMAYTWQSVLSAFITTSLMFFILVFMGNVLKIDLTKIWNILLGALFALIIGMLINLFWQNQTFNLWLNIIGLVIFAWLIMWDMAFLKQAALMGDRRIEIVMALSFYLDFINIFLTLLRLFGERNE